MGFTVEQSDRAFYGDQARLPNAPNLLGLGANKIAERVFGQEISGIDVLMRHTLFGFYGRFLPDTTRESWAKDLFDFRGRALASYIDITSGPLSSLGELRKCTECISQDHEDGRLAAWRVLHQLPFLNHCAEHSSTLISHCAACKQPYERGSDYRLPSDGCRYCNSVTVQSQKVESRPGALSLGNLCARIFNGFAGHLEPTQWGRCVAATVSKLEGLDESVRAIEGHLRRTWRVRSISDLSAVLGRKLPRDFVRLELQLEGSPRVVLPRLLTYSAIESLVPEISNDGPPEIPQRLAIRRNVNGEAERLAEMANAHAIARGVIDRLISGDSQAAVIKREAISRRRLQQFIKLLPIDLGEYLAAQQRAGRTARQAQNQTTISKRERLRGERRQTLLDALAVNPGLRRIDAAGLMPTEYRWLTGNDSIWLDSVLPTEKAFKPRRFRSDIERKKAYRADVLKLLKARPTIGRNEAVLSLPKAMAWLRFNDRVWFDKNVPVRAHQRISTSWYKSEKPLVLPAAILKRRYADDDERTRAAKKFVSQVKTLNPHLLRSEICRVCSSAIVWLRAREPAWLKANLPPRADPSLVKKRPRGPSIKP